MAKCSAYITIADVIDGENAISYVVDAVMTGTPDGSLSINIYKDGILCTDSIYVKIRAFNGSVWSDSPLSATITTGTLSGNYTGVKAFNVSVMTDSTQSAEMLGSTYISYGDQGIPGDPGNDAIYADLTRDSAQVPANSDGTSPVFTGITTTIKLFKGGNEVTTNVTYSKADNGCTSTLTGNTITSISAMPGNSATITLTATLTSVTPNLSYSKVFTLTKQLKGVQGESTQIDYALNESVSTHPANGYLAFDENTYLAYNEETLTYAIYTGSVVQQTGTYVWARTLNPDGTYTYACQTGMRGAAGTPAQVFAINIESQTYEKNMRVSSERNSIDISADIQGYSSYNMQFSVTPNTCTFYSSGTNISTSSSDTLYIPYNTYGPVVLTLSDTASGTTIEPVSVEISPIDRTEYVHDFGAVTELPTTFTDSWGNTCGLLDGDYFIAAAVFSLVNPASNTTIGQPYFYVGLDGSWSPLVVNNAQDAEKALKLLSDALNNNVPIPIDVNNPAYVMIKTLVAQTAVIQNLFSQAITILSGGHIKGGNRYDANGNIIDWSKNGFWFGDNGKLKANLQSDNTGNTYVGTDVGDNTVISSSEHETGNNNSALGYQALYSVTTGDNNVAIGTQALYNAVKAYGNVAVGYQSMYNAIGASSGSSIASDVFSNVAIGRYALKGITQGIQNVAIGDYSMIYSSNYPSSNVGVGANTLQYNRGSNNVALGDAAMYNNITGTRNVSVGSLSLYQGTTSVENVSIGHEAMSNATGSYDTALGYRALYKVTGNYNTAIGHSALKNTTSGTYNAGLGYNSLSSNTTGSYNVGVGYNSLSSNTTGTYNVGINGNGYSATGSYQININDRLISLDFRKGRQYKQVFTVLKSFFKTSTYEEISCLGSFEGNRAYSISYNNDGSSDYISIQTSDGLYTMKSNTSTSTVLTYKATLCFIKPCQKDISTSISDCLS